MQLSALAIRNAKTRESIQASWRARSLSARKGKRYTALADELRTHGATENAVLWRVAV